MNAILLFVLSLLHAQTKPIQNQQRCEGQDICIEAGKIGSDQKCREQSRTIVIPYQYKVCAGDGESRICSTMKQRNIKMNLSCPIGEVLCEPLVFGYKDGNPTEIDIKGKPSFSLVSQANPTPPRNFAPICVPLSGRNDQHESQRCYRASIPSDDPDATSVHRPVSLKYNQMAWSQYKIDFLKLCKKENLDCISRLNNSHSVSVRKAKETRDLCDWANFRLSKERDIPDNYGNLTSRFIDLSDTSRCEPNLDQGPKFQNVKIDSPYFDNTCSQASAPGASGGAQ